MHRKMFQPYFMRFNKDQKYTTSTFQITPILAKGAK